MKDFVVVAIIVGTLQTLIKYFISTQGQIRSAIRGGVLAEQYINHKTSYL